DTTSASVLCSRISRLAARQISRSGIIPVIQTQSCRNPSKPQQMNTKPPPSTKSPAQRENREKARYARNADRHGIRHHASNASSLGAERPGATGSFPDKAK